jgi:tetratricopeptide (TPR) repeat protein
MKTTSGLKSGLISALLLTLCCTGLAQAQPSSYGALARMQTRWAEINYQMQGKAQLGAFEQLLDEAETFVQQHPEDADMLIWDGIIKSSYAGASGGLGALKYAKAAKADFEKSIELNPTALSGSAYTSLGTLYFKVPGWPLGFGDDKRAEQLLRKAVEINPTGIDPNYFLGEYLRDQDRYAEAVQYYRKALQAPARPGRELADRERRREVQTAMEAAEKQLK